MFKVFKRKRAINDVSIVAIILFIFLGTALTLPFVNSEFNIQGSSFNTNKTQSDLIGEDISNVSDIGVGEIIKSIGKMFFWTFGELPVWLDLIFTVLRIILIFILIRNFTPFLGGGG